MNIDFSKKYRLIPAIIQDSETKAFWCWVTWTKKHILKLLNTKVTFLAVLNKDFGQKERVVTFKLGWYKKMTVMVILYWYKQNQLDNTIQVQILAGKQKKSWLWVYFTLRQTIETRREKADSEKSYVASFLIRN
jgi:hypothetical protein